MFTKCSLIKVTNTHSPSALPLQINGRFPRLGNPWKPMETQFPLVSTGFHTVSIGFQWQTRKCRFSLTNTQLYMVYIWGAIGHTSSASVAYCLPNTYMYVCWKNIAFQVNICHRWKPVETQSRVTTGSWMFPHMIVVSDGFNEFSSVFTMRHISMDLRDIYRFS